ncbi:MAG: response regulator transcription factor [bacterium]|nr:response regulator transcription factor [bacterium]
MMSRLKVLVVDDERLARKELISMLSGFDNLEIVDEADSVSTAVKSVRKHAPDVIFLDIQMPGGYGFELLEKVDIKAKIIFVTAYDEYAIRAFEVNALDYILKPVDPKRLTDALERLKKAPEEQKENLRKLQYDDRLFLLLDSNYKFLNVKDIISVNSSGDYTEISLAEGKMNLAMKTMKEWEHRLPEQYFCRIHRSTIINIEYIDKIEEWFNYSFKVFLKGIDEPFIMSRRYAAALKERYG